MKLHSAPGLPERDQADLLVLPFWHGKEKPESTGDFSEFSFLYDAPISMKDFTGKEGELLLLYNESGKKEPRILLLGLGDKKKGSDEGVRRAFAAVVKECARKKIKNVNAYVPEAKYERAVAEGMLLTNYHYLRLKAHSQNENPYVPLEKIYLIGGHKGVLQKIEKIIESVDFARDLVNGNADDIDPDALVTVATVLAEKYPLVKLHLLRKKELVKEKMGLMLAVCRGALVEPALIVLEYRGAPESSETIAIIGKGVTYDTGGLNLKPTGSMETMKCDMAGAGAVLGTIRAIAELGLKCNVLGVVAAVENAIGPGSYKPGDVYTSYSGKTVEISNTDAEGRLVLADAFSYIHKHFQPTQMIDLATLTGGVVIALGEEITGLFSNNDALAKELIAAGEKTHEGLWRLPLLPEYKDKLKSSIADIKNSGPRSASAATAAVFLEQFIEKLPWAHLDIAGTAFLSEPKHYHQTPATGVGVRLLVEWLQTKE